MFDVNISSIANQNYAMKMKRKRQQIHSVNLSVNNKYIFKEKYKK